MNSGFSGFSPRLFNWIPLQATKEVEKMTCIWINLALRRHFVFGF